MNVQKFINSLREAYNLDKAVPNKFILNAFEKAISHLPEVVYDNLVQAIRESEPRFPDVANLPKIIKELGFNDYVVKNKTDDYLNQYGITFKDALENFNDIVRNYHWKLYEEVKKEKNNGEIGAFCKVNFTIVLNKILSDFKTWFLENKKEWSDKFNLSDSNVVGALCYQNTNLKKDIKDGCLQMYQSKKEGKNGLFNKFIY